ncbi:MAG: LPFR motif small protein [Pseudonocardiales bacterium]
MPGPARRGGGALSAIGSTIVNVITLPFRVLGRLFGGNRRPRR